MHSTSMMVWISYLEMEWGWVHDHITALSSTNTQTNTILNEQDSTVKLSRLHTVEKNSPSRLSCIDVCCTNTIAAHATSGRRHWLCAYDMLHIVTKRVTIKTCHLIKQIIFKK